MYSIKVHKDLYCRHELYCARPQCSATGHLWPCHRHWAGDRVQSWHSTHTRCSRYIVYRVPSCSSLTIHVHVLQLVVAMVRTNVGVMTLYLTPNDSQLYVNVCTCCNALNCRPTTMYSMRLYFWGLKTPLPNQHILQFHVIEHTAMHAQPLTTCAPCRWTGPT